jgi:hypothetical protein
MAAETASRRAPSFRAPYLSAPPRPKVQLALPNNVTLSPPNGGFPTSDCFCSGNALLLMLGHPGRRVFAEAWGQTRGAGLLPRVTSAALVSLSSFSSVQRPSSASSPRRPAPRAALPDS